MPLRLPSGSSVALLTISLASGAALSPLEAEDCPLLELPEGRNFERREDPLPAGWNDEKNLGPGPGGAVWFPGPCAHIRASGEVELILVLVGRSPLALDILEQEPSIVQLDISGVFVPLGRMWVRSLSDHDDDQTTGLYLRKDRLTQYGLEQEPPIPEIDETALQDVRFVWTLRRRTEHPCSMAMVVDGDASGEFTGDVAYYNYRKPGEGVYEGSAAGTWADEGAQEMVEGLVEWAAGIGDMMDEMGLELPDGSELPSTEELEKAKKKVGDKEVGWAEQLWGWDGENRGSDTFGLALADVELENTALPDGTPKPPVEGFLQGAAKLASAASLGVSGRAVARKDVPATEKGQPEMEALLIEPSRVTAIAGVVDDNLEGIKYLWEPGRPGSATVVVVREIGSGVIRGIVAAELFPERTWAGGPQGIRVVATFRAMPTSLLCQ